MMLTGKVAVVTGSGGGAGRHTARTLAANGAKVVVNDVRDGAAEAVADEIRGEGGDAVAVDASVADVEGAAAIIDTSVNEFGRIDILVNNAAILRRGLVHETPIQDWDDVIAVHLRGTFLCCRAAAPHMIRAGAGRIINTTSTAALAAVPATSSYAAAKAGIMTLSMLLAKELAFHGVTVNVVEPLGGAGGSSLGTSPLTDMAQRVRLAYGWSFPPRAADAPPPPEARIPTTVGSLIAYLSSDVAEYINGQVIGVTDSSLRLWSPYSVAQTLHVGSDVTSETLKNVFPTTLGLGLSNDVPTLPQLRSDTPSRTER
ncbi:SDR family NAD(P)-dependent oxidoreductase [Microbacterium sp. zg.B48]|uniref:SDR family NAD(P)-dependent oxidoreductase n=1 Tax=Microbacterium sp. zg.B48 TaxID=2969408 RepID=UPI00214CDA44|nr:SDR family NAD(P)-dependent oxidoreductase [Microbacterium sp. zg.B48]MCR2764369.1 SDR family NAD(P)-dependent oxidoreductase [Microbacterium sp. zg.B48]